MIDMNTNDDYEGLTPIETEDEMRERYARLEAETIASWPEEEQRKQAEIDKCLTAKVVINKTAEDIINFAKQKHGTMPSFRDRLRHLYED